MNKMWAAIATGIVGLSMGDYAQSSGGFSVPRWSPLYPSTAGQWNKAVGGAPLAEFDVTRGGFEVKCTAPAGLKHCDNLKSGVADGVHYQAQVGQTANAAEFGTRFHMPDGTEIKDDRIMMSRSFQFRKGDGPQGGLSEVGYYSYARTLAPELKGYSIGSIRHVSTDGARIRVLTECTNIFGGNCITVTPEICAKYAIAGPSGKTPADELNSCAQKILTLRKEVESAFQNQKVGINAGLRRFAAMGGEATIAAAELQKQVDGVKRPGEDPVGLTGLSPGFFSVESNVGHLCHRMREAGVVFPAPAPAAAGRSKTFTGANQAD